MAFPLGTLVVATSVQWPRHFAWLDRMLRHRAYPTNTMIGGDNG